MLPSQSPPRTVRGGEWGLSAQLYFGEGDFNRASEEERRRGAVAGPAAPFRITKGDPLGLNDPAETAGYVSLPIAKRLCGCSALSPFSGLSPSPSPSFALSPSFSLARGSVTLELLRVFDFASSPLRAAYWNSAVCRTHHNFEDWSQKLRSWLPYALSLRMLAHAQVFTNHNKDLCRMQQPPRS